MIDDLMELREILLDNIDEFKEEAFDAEVLEDYDDARVLRGKASTMTDIVERLESILDKENIRL